MSRFTNCGIRVNKDYVTRLVKYKHGTIENFLKSYKITRMRFWQILNQPHLSKEVPCLQKLAEFLKVTVDEIVKEN